MHGSPRQAHQFGINTSAQVSSSRSQPQYEPSNGDTQDPRISAHSYGNPAMAFVLEGENLRERSFAFKKEPHEYMEGVPFVKVVIGINTSGRESDIPPSETNPLVVTIKIASDDINYVTREIHETCLRLVRQYFEESVPPLDSTFWTR